MKFILIISIFMTGYSSGNGTITSIPGFSSIAACEQAAERYRSLNEGKGRDIRTMCAPAE